MRIVAVDPGTTRSALVIYDVEKAEVVLSLCDENKFVRELLGDHDAVNGDIMSSVHLLVIEMIASYGMPVGREIFETCVWIGRFVEVWCQPWEFEYRQAVKLELCGSSRAKDANIRQALIDRFGGKEKAIGRKSNPGPLYGIHGDQWAALGVAVTWASRHMRALAKAMA